MRDHLGIYNSILVGISVAASIPVRRQSSNGLNQWSLPPWAPLTMAPPFEPFSPLISPRVVYDCLYIQRPNHDNESVFQTMQYHLHRLLGNPVACRDNLNTDPDNNIFSTIWWQDHIPVHTDYRIAWLREEVIAAMFAQQTDLMFRDAYQFDWSIATRDEAARLKWLIAHTAGFVESVSPRVFGDYGCLIGSRGTNLRDALIERMEVTCIDQALEFVDRALGQNTTFKTSGPEQESLPGTSGF